MRINLVFPMALTRVSRRTSRTHRCRCGGVSALFVHAFDARPSEADESEERVKAGPAQRTRRPAEDVEQTHVTGGGSPRQPSSGTTSLPRRSCADAIPVL